MKLLIDGDILVYRAGFACNDQPVENALQACKMMLGSIKKRCKFTGCEIYLTSTDHSNYRYDIATVRPYKGNRITQEKPKHYDAIREYLVDVHKAIVTYGQEADDALGIEQTRAGLAKTVIVTVDKDLDQIAGWHFNPKKDLKYYIEPEQGDWVFYYQLLTGDATDNIQGVQGVGPVKARRILSKCNNQQQMLEACIKAYDNDLELMTEMAQLVRIRRQEDELWVIPPRTIEDLEKVIEADLKRESLNKLETEKESSGTKTKG